MSNFNQESVLSVHHWTDNLFSFPPTRDPSFRFRNGEFTMIGLKIGEKPLLRAYSVASANYEDRLEFFSIQGPDGSFYSRLPDLYQGAGWSFDLAPPASEARRRDHRQPQGDRHTGDRQSRERAKPVSDRHRHRAGAVPERDQGSRNLRAFRESGAAAWLPPRRRTRLWRDDHRAPAKGRSDRRTRPQPVDLLSDCDARSVPQSRPDHRPDHVRQTVQRCRPCATRARTGSGHDLRQSGAGP